MAHQLKTLPIIFCVIFSMICLLPAVEPIRSLAEVRALSQEMAQKNLPVHMEVTVVYVDRGAYDIIVHDHSAACYVIFDLRDLPAEKRPRVGDRLLIAGETRANGFFPHVQVMEWHLVGRSELPEPYRISADEIFLPRFDSAWVEVPAVVVGIEKGGLAYTVAVEIFGQIFKADLPKSEDADARATALLQRPVKMKGILATIYNENRQLTGRHFFVPSFDCFTPSAPAVDATKARALRINELLQSSSSVNDLVRLEGVIMQHDSKGFYLQDESAGTFIQGVKADHLPLGTRVSVEGYGSLAPFRPILRAIRVNEISRGKRPKPEPMNFHATDVTRFQTTLVTLQAVLGNIRKVRHETILQCTSNGVQFEAVLPAETDHPDWQVGDTIRLTGICELTTTHPMPRTEWVDGFRMRLENPDAVKILIRSPWWTTERLLTALSLMTGLAMLGGFSTLFFRRVISQQARVIGAQLGSEAVSEERDRMARDLHDTLEQQLTGVSMQLQSIVQSSHEKSPAVAERLMLATRMLEHSREEARRSVWDLRNRLLETHGLTAALKSLVESAAIDGGPQVELRLSGDASAISSSADYQLLRMTQEALTNALKHAKAKRILISLETTATHHRLSIEDDGIGFDAEIVSPMRAPHFGLIGMRERAEKIGARLEMKTQPGAGCVICIELPLLPLS